MYTDPSLPLLRRSLRTRLLALLLAAASLATTAGRAAAAAAIRYDVLYLWTDTLDNALDYQEELERLLGPEVGRKLEVVARDDNGQYGVIYDRNGTALSSARVAVRHSLLLKGEEFGEARAIKDQGYHQLYNVCYGLGPNLTTLRQRFGTIYHYLGSEVGKDLYIEKTDSGKFALIYRRRGDRDSTAAVARRHAKLLASKHLTASITKEDNNEEVFGESSYLDDEEETPASAPPVAVANADQAPTAARTPSPALLVAGNLKRPVAGEAGNDTALEQRLEEYIQGLRQNGQVSDDEKTGWLVIDLTKGETLVDINVDSPYQAASMIKPLFALAFFHLVKERRLTYGPKSRRMMAAMIQRSSNTAADWVLKQAGGPQAVQHILHDHYGQIFRETSIVEYIPKNGRTYRNKASAKDYGRFLTALWRKELPYGKELRRLMALPGRDRLYCGTPIPRGCLVYNKTGSTARLCGDMGILAPQAKDGRRYPYVVVGIIEKEHKARDYGSWKMARSNVIRHVSTMVYEKMKESYNLL